VDKSGPDGHLQARITGEDDGGVIEPLLTLVISPLAVKHIGGNQTGSGDFGQPLWTAVRKSRAPASYDKILRSYSVMFCFALYIA
jgi:hypothetical protein